MNTHARTISRADIAEAFRRWQAANPNPTTELNFDTPFQLLVAVVLSAQATDKSVNIATRSLFAVAPTANKMMELGEEKIANYIKIIGLYRNKAKNIAMLSRILMMQYDGQVPHSRAKLEALPGVGRKTANVVLNTLWREPVMAVDTHIFRVSNRMGLAPGKDVLAVEQALMKRVPKAYLIEAHHWLILHGRYVCKARKPDCANCLVRDLCTWQEKTDLPPPIADTIFPPKKTRARRANQE